MPLDPGQLLPFLVASLVVTVVPGADMALVTRQVLVGGMRLAQRTIAGNLTGLLVHGVALAAGLSTLLLASAAAYTAVKFAGACYLVYLGLQALRTARRQTGKGSGATSESSCESSARLVPSSRAAYTQGLISTVLNPKPALFFISFLPQFIDSHRALMPQALTMAGLHIFVGWVWLTVYAQLVHRAHRVLTRSSVAQRLEQVTGIILIGLGMRIAVERG